ncbi:UNVERIFIED_CONTAM: hypothetical protein HDU68_011031 [Siphonaria sp. JEL0065]|nr:hypothetical protein HDU68_011031 [Siphonaria sp. JEL0065]
MSWTCNVCTFINEKPLGLFCEVCECERQSPVATSPKPTKPSNVSTLTATATTQPSNSSMPSRAQLEKERLARLANAQSKSSRSTTVTKRLHSPPPSTSTSTSTKKPRLSPNSYPTQPSKARILLTQIAPFPASKTTTTFTQVVQTPRKAFLSAFQFDLPWIASHLPPHIPICLALHNPTPNAKPKIQGNIALVFPKLATATGAYSTMHVKLCVFYYAESVRVVVSSANLVDYDWDRLENVVWCQDFPVKLGRGNTVGGSNFAEAADEDENSIGAEFKNDLIQLLKDMGAQEWVWEGLDAFDFSSCRARLVVSKPGKFVDEDAFKYGLGRLSSIVNEGFGRTGQFKKVVQEASLFYQTSSLGSLSTQWLTDFESSARGTLFSATTKTLPKPIPTINILYPTEETIENSHLGRNGGGTITWNQKMWEQCEYKHLLRDPTLKRVRSLAHSKIILCQSKEGNNEKERGCYMYLGSHNMTMSAWGRASVVGKVKKEKQLYITNWELGVVLIGPELMDCDNGGTVMDDGSAEWVIPFDVDGLRSHGVGVRAAHVN